jgi:hypothetical protein
MRSLLALTAVGCAAALTVASGSASSDRRPSGGGVPTSQDSTPTGSAVRGSETKRPGRPRGFRYVGRTASTIRVNWGRPAGKVGKYALFRGRARVAWTRKRSYTYRRLRCGRSYRLAVVAVDRAGNRSVTARITASTAACTRGRPRSRKLPPAPPPSLFVAPSGSDSNACRASAPCASLNRAYRVARPGQSVQLAAGTYPAQTIRHDPAKANGSKHVYFVPAPGTVPVISGDLANRAAWVRIERIRVNGGLFPAEGGPNAHHVIFDSMDSASFEVGPGHDITLSNSDIGPSRGCGFSQENKIGPDGNIPNAAPYNIQILDNYIHDQNGNPSGGCHFGGLFVIAGHHLAFSGNRFVRNVVYDFYVSPFASDSYGGVHDVVVENNVFAGPVEWLPRSTTWDGQPNLQFTCHGNPTPTNCMLRNWLVRFNSFYGGLHFFNRSTGSNFRVVANVGDSPDGSNCSRASFSYNVWKGDACGPTDRRVRSYPYVNTDLGAPNYRLRRESGVSGIVPGSSADQRIGTDLDGKRRPAAKLSPGAYEP